MSVGPSELVVIVLVAFLLFGSRRLADLGKGIGDGIRGFKRGIAGETDDKVAAASSEPPKEPKQLTGRVETTAQLSDTASVGNHPGDAATTHQIEPSSVSNAEPATAPVATNQVAPVTPAGGREQTSSTS
ncbi:MAG TPA: twin-arginine translocase TatA/TatE family subunit [Polyangiaceae bacterium]